MLRKIGIGIAVVVMIGAAAWSKTGLAIAAGTLVVIQVALYALVSRRRAPSQEKPGLVGAEEEIPEGEQFARVGSVVDEELKPHRRYVTMRSLASGKVLCYEMSADPPPFFLRQTDGQIVALRPPGPSAQKPVRLVPRRRP